VIKKIPAEAFDYYVSLGPERSYELVARRFGASKRGVAKRAASEHWQERLEAIDREVQERTDARLVSEIDEMKTRHLKTVRAMLGRAVKGLREYPITSGMDAIRAAELSIKLERLVMGEASERTEMNVLETIKGEMSRWLVPKEEEGVHADHATVVHVRHADHATSLPATLDPEA